MSGMSYMTTCPLCEWEAFANSESKPFEMTDIDCYECWFYTTTNIWRLWLEDLLSLKEHNFESEYEWDTDSKEYKEELEKVLTETKKTYNDHQLDEIW